MFMKIGFSSVVLIVAVIGIGIVQDMHNSVRGQLQGCIHVNDNPKYMVYQCASNTYYIPLSERGQL